jgi:hypothetical protein
MNVNTTSVTYVLTGSYWIAKRGKVRYANSIMLLYNNNWQKSFMEIRIATKILDNEYDRINFVVLVTV